MAERRKKQVVHVENSAAANAEGSSWKPTAEAKGKAGGRRLFAVLLWLLAIGGEAFAILWILKQTPVNMIWLIGALVVIGLLAVGGSLLWKQANRLDPASKSEPTRFFIQNQLGAIITMIAFAPLIVLIFLNKDMDGKQKGIAGGVGIVLLLVAGYFGADFKPPSTEQYTAETSKVVELTGQDHVYWTKSGEVFHLCADASAVNLDSKDGKIYEGTVAEAHAEGKSRLTLQVDQEVEQCGLTPVAKPTDG